MGILKVFSFMRSFILSRNDCYRIDYEYIYLPKGLKLKYKGELRWIGKPGRLEIVYDEVDEVWRGFMAVEIEKPPLEEAASPSTSTSA